MEHYCHNCRCWDTLDGGVYCGWCMNFFYDNSRLPTREDARD